MYLIVFTRRLHRSHIIWHELFFGLSWYLLLQFSLHQISLKNSLWAIWIYMEFLICLTGRILLYLNSHRKFTGLSDKLRSQFTDRSRNPLAPGNHFPCTRGLKFFNQTLLVCVHKVTRSLHLISVARWGLNVIKHF